VSVIADNESDVEDFNSANSHIADGSGCLKIVKGYN